MSNASKFEVPAPAESGIVTARRVEIVSVPFHGSSIAAVHVDGIVYVVVRRICEMLGIDFAGQTVKLKNSEWARVAMITTPDKHGENQDYFCIPLRQLPRWLLSISANRVAPEAVEPLLRLQDEASEVLYRYFFGGGVVVNPRLDEQVARDAFDAEQARLKLEKFKALCEREVLAYEYKTRADLLAILGPQVGEEWHKKEAMYLYGVVSGDNGKVDDPQIFVSDFLTSKGHDRRWVEKNESSFGKLVASLYRKENGRDPEKQPRRYANGKTGNSNVYYKRHMHLLEKAYKAYFKEGT